MTWFQNTSFAWVKPQGNRYEGQLLYNRLVYKNPVPLLRFLLMRSAVSVLEQFTAVQTRKCEWLLVSKMKLVFCSVGCDVLWLSEQVTLFRQNLLPAFSGGRSSSWSTEFLRSTQLQNCTTPNPQTQYRCWSSLAQIQISTHTVIF